MKGCGNVENIPFIASSESRLKRLEQLRRFFVSKPFMLFCVLIGCVVTVTRTEFAGLLFFGVIILVMLLVCDELVATTLPFMMISCIMVKCYDSFSTYVKLVWLFPLCAIVFFAHFFLYKKPIKVGSTIWSLIFVSISVFLGGMGVLPAKDYFSLTSLYYMVGLGPAMILVYVVIYSYFGESKNSDSKQLFAYAMTLGCLMACLMVLLHYAVNIEKVIEHRSILEPQWRNNVSTIIMLTMPFPFYLSIKKTRYFAAALITLPCLVLSSSRGGLIFGAAEFALCCIYILYTDKKHRNLYLIIFAICGCALIFMAGDILSFISKTLARFGFEDMSNEPRAGLFQRAIENFRDNPVFGYGIGYMGNRDIHPSKEFAACWYHSSPFQIIGSFGIIGIFAFGYQFIRRNTIFWSKITYYTLAIYISYIGILMMSLVNPGEFCPIPYELLVVMMFAILEKSCPKNKERILFWGKYAASEKEEIKEAVNI